MKSLLLGLTIVISLAVRLTADPITPLSYEYSPGLAPIANYGFYVPQNADFSGKLTDGDYGGVSVGNLGGSNPSGLVAFGGAGGVIFHFSGTAAIETIILDFIRYEDAGVYLPDVLTVNGVDRSNYSGVFPDATHAPITLNGNWSGDVTIFFSHTTWVFLDEVSFYGSSGDNNNGGGGNSVPEAGSTMALLAIALILLFLAKPEKGTGRWFALARCRAQQDGVSKRGEY